MSGKIYTILPALPYENLLAATHIAVTAALCGLLLWAIRRPAEG